MTHVAEDDAVLFRLTGVGVVETDLATGRLVRANRAFCEMVGYSEDELVGMTYLELTHPDDQARDAEAFQGLQRSEQRDGTSLTRVLHKDGGTVWLELSITVLGQGDTARNLTVATDVTARERVRREAKESAAQLRALITASADAVYSMSADWNEMRFLHGKSFIADTTEPSVSWLDSYIPEQDKPAVLAVVQAAIDSKSIFELEHRVVRADGSLGWTASRAIPLLDANGELDGWLGTAQDITERKRAETVLRDNEARLQLALSAAELGTFVWHVTEDRTEEDARARAYFGLPPDTTITLAEALVTTFHPDDGPRYAAAVARATDPTGPGTMREEFRIRHPDGQERWMEVSATAAFEGTPPVAVRLTGVLADITERKRAEAALRESDARHAFLLNLSDALRKETRVEAVGNRAVQMIAETLGLDRVYLVSVTPGDDNIVVTHEVRRADMPPLLGFYRGSEFPDAMKEIFERTIVYDDVRADPRLGELDRRSLAGLGAVGFIAAPILREEGEMIWAGGGLSTQPRSWTANEIALFEEAIEHSWAAVERARAEAALRASEERLRLTVESIPDYAIFTTDPEGAITSWNSGAERVFGYIEADIIGQQVVRLFTPEDREAGIPGQESRAAREQGKANDDRWHLRKDGSRFYVSGTVAPLWEGGQLTGYVKIARDLTQQREAEEEREILLEAVQDFNTALEKRVSARTKQVQNLAAQLTLTEAQERARLAQVLHDELQQQLYAVQFSLRGLRVHLSDNATAVTQLEDTKHVVDGAIAICRSTTANLSPPVLRHEGLVEALTWLGSDMAARYQLVVTVEASASFTVPDEEVRVLLFNLVRELLFNVVKHAEVGDALVTLHQNAEQLELTVSDLGKGFDPAKLAESSTGLGLAGVRQRLELFGGQLDLVSTPHEGTRVTIFLPAESFTLS